MTTRTLALGLCYLCQVILLGLAVESQADGNFITRPATAQEKEFILKTKQSLKSGLPALPSGWVVENESPLMAEDTVTFPGKEVPLEIKYISEFKRVEGIQERTAARDKAVADSAAARIKMNALSNTIREKISEADKARASGDRAAYEKAKSEMEASQKEYDELMEGPSNPVRSVNEAEFNLRRDTTIHLKANVNSGYEGISGPLQPLQVPGSVAAYRRDFEDRNRASKALILFGDWKLEKFGEGQNFSLSARRVPTKSDRITATYTVAVEFEADRERLSELVSAVDAAAVMALLTLPPS